MPSDIIDTAKITYFLGVIFINFAFRVLLRQYLLDSDDMIEEKNIENALKELFDKIEFTSEPKGLYDPLRYMIQIGGKRIRPRLCLLTYSLFKDSLNEGILQSAAALEVFHTFTLIHDDIMDKSPLRRGQATVWTKWNEDTAILSGDVMSIDSYRRLAFCPGDKLPQVLELFSKTAAEVCEGQQYDMDFESEDFVDMSRYMKMIGLKTAVLIACAAKMGAIIGGASDEEADNLYAYGYDLGLAFQIADDYLDAYGDEKVFGKPIGGDIVNNKKSWLLTRAFEKTHDKKSLCSLMALPSESVEQRVSKIMFVKAEYNKLGINAEALAAIREYSDRAMSHVSGMGYEGELKKFAEGLVGRVK